jgi:hypothetical protein
MKRGHRELWSLLSVAALLLAMLALLAGCGSDAATPDPIDAPEPASGTVSPPAQPPAAPSHVQILSGNGQVTLGWDYAQGATGYTIYWSTRPGVTPQTGIAQKAYTNPYVHTGLANGSTYYYVVTATNRGGSSGASAEVSAMPMAPGAGVPGGASALAGLWSNVTYTGHTAQIELKQWTDAAGQERWSVHGWGFCTPTYCDWGEVPATRQSNGEVYGKWDFGWSTLEVWARMSVSQPGHLETYLWTDFADWDGRTDYGMTETYNRVR